MIAFPQATERARRLTFGDVADSNRNNLRIARLVAATAVIFRHAYSVNLGVPLGPETEPLYRWTGVGSGDLAVDVFFVISGFLVTKSLLHSRAPIRFALSRALRIFPGLFCAAIVTALLLGPLLTELPLAAYLKHPITIRFIAYDTIALIPKHFYIELPGVFAHSPYPGVIAGSWWTLPWELWMYVTLLGLFLVRAMGRLYPAVAAAIALIYLAFAVHWWNPSSLDVGHAVRFVAFFHAGVCCYVFRKRIPLSLSGLAIATVVMVVVNVATQSAVLLPAWLAYAVLTISYHPRLVMERWCDGPDYSYGMYIYAFAMQQVIVQFIGIIPAPIHSLLAVVMTLPFAMLSWHFVEEPALKLKSRLRSNLPSASPSPQGI